MKEFNVYIISSASDWDIAKKNIPFIVKNIPARKIFIVSSKEIKNDVLLIDKCDFIDENEVFSGLSFSAVHQYLEQKGFIAANTGWFLQQFIKLALAFWVDDEYYLTWDADTIPMRKIEFFDENDKPLFNLKREYFFEYFRTIKNLFGYDKKTEESFISEHMMFNKQFVIEMLDRISNDDKLHGDNFWQKIFFASDLSVPGHIKKDERFFSEFETYGTFVDHNYPDVYSKRKLTTLRYGADFFGYNLSDEIYDWIAKDFDTVSFEKWAKPMEEFIGKTKDENFRTQTTSLEYIKLICKTKKQKAYLAVLKRDFNTVRNYLSFIGSTKFDFVFEDKLGYESNKNIAKKIIDFIKSLILKILGYKE